MPGTLGRNFTLAIVVHPLVVILHMPLPAPLTPAVHRHAANGRTHVRLTPTLPSASLHSRADPNRPRPFGLFRVAE